MLYSKRSILRMCVSSSICIRIYICEKVTEFCIGNDYLVSWSVSIDVAEHLFMCAEMKSDIFLPLKFQDTILLKNGESILDEVGKLFSNPGNEYVSFK